MWLVWLGDVLTKVGVFTSSNSFHCCVVVCESVYGEGKCCVLSATSNNAKVSVLMCCCCELFFFFLEVGDEEDGGWRWRWLTLKMNKTKWRRGSTWRRNVEEAFWIGSSIGLFSSNKWYSVPARRRCRSGGYIWFHVEGFSSMALRIASTPRIRLQGWV